MNQTIHIELIQWTPLYFLDTRFHKYNSVKKFNIYNLAWKSRFTEEHVVLWVKFTLKANSLIGSANSFSSLPISSPRWLFIMVLLVYREILFIQLLLVIYIRLL